MGRTILVTGTDTGVGKTLLTGLLLEALRQRGVHALAMKPFCTGDRSDVAALQAFQRGELTADEMNPFWFKEPLAPEIAARKERRTIDVSQAVVQIRAMARRCEVLLVEGVGGVLVPLARGTTVANFAAELACEVVVVGRNQIGTLNHVHLTIEALRARGLACRSIVLMGQKRPDPSAPGNVAQLRKTLPNIGVYSVPFLGNAALKLASIRSAAKKLQKVLARI